MSSRGLGARSNWGCLPFVLFIGAALTVAAILTKLGVISW